MNLKYRAFLIAVIILSTFPVFGQTPAEVQDYVKRLTSSYSAWNTVELNGKLSMEGLPVRPSVKIFMERGTTLMISIRAPFVGEAGRIEISGDNILAVNKMKKVYVSDNIRNLVGGLPVSVSDVQDAILARAFLLNFGTLSAENFALANIERFDADNWLIVPLSRPSGLYADYGFSCDAEGRLRMLFATDGGDMQAMIQYEYPGKKSDLTFSFVQGNKGIEAQLSLDAPKWNVSAMEPFRPDSKYKKTGIKEFLKLF